MGHWNSLYWYCANQEAAASALRESLRALHYDLYDAFTLIPGKAYRDAVRLFVAPARNGWVRVIGTPDERQFSTLSEIGLCLVVTLDETQADIMVYAGGQAATLPDALIPHLRDGRSPDDLQQVLSQHFAPSDGDAGNDLPLDALPQDIQHMAENVNMKQAQKMFNRLSRHLLQNAGDDADAARQLLQSSAPDWNSAGGQRIRALMACLTIPDGWHEPDFVALRDAYQLHLRRQRTPNARLLPGDDDTLAAVPNALDYIPVYGGINP